MKYLIIFAAFIFILIIYFVVTFYKYIDNNSLEQSINNSSKILENNDDIEDNKVLEKKKVTHEKSNKISKKNNDTEDNNTFEKKKVSHVKSNNESENNLLMTIEHGNKNYEIELSLYDDIVPLTCKNFRFLSGNKDNNKNYSGSIFHRVIKDFMIQGGDIVNNDGTGSISLYGNNFEDENFIKKHDKPGLLSMANSGPNTNGSQFFITTVPTPHLDNKHVVFGEVVNGFKIIELLQNCETDDTDKPITPIHIKNITLI